LVRDAQVFELRRAILLPGWIQPLPSLNLLDHASPEPPISGLSCRLRQIDGGRVLLSSPVSEALA